MFIAIGLALYSLRRIRIMRAIGNLRTEDAHKVVYKKVDNYNFNDQSRRLIPHKSQSAIHMSYMNDKAKPDIVVEDSESDINPNSLPDFNRSIE